MCDVMLAKSLWCLFAACVLWMATYHEYNEGSQRYSFGECYAEASCCLPVAWPLPATSPSNKATERTTVA